MTLSAWGVVILAFIPAVLLACELLHRREIRQKVRAGLRQVDRVYPAWDADRRKVCGCTIRWNGDADRGEVARCDSHELAYRVARHRAAACGCVTADPQGRPVAIFCPAHCPDCAPLSVCPVHDVQLWEAMEKLVQQ